MGATSRSKGQRGELEVAALLTTVTGQDVRRKVRQHDGDSDLEGIDGWCIEVKRHAAAPPASISAWWAQAHRQAIATYKKPVLLYRANRGAWRAVWAPSGGSDYLDTCEADPGLWWRMTGAAGP